MAMITRLKKSNNEKDSRRRNRLFPENRVLWVCILLLLFVKVGADENGVMGFEGMKDSSSGMIQQWNLEPSSMLLSLEPNKGGRRRLSEEQTRELWLSSFEKSWTNRTSWNNLYTPFMELEVPPMSSPDLVEMVEEHNLRVKEWENQRHLSRHEQLYREEQKRRKLLGEWGLPQQAPLEKQQWVPLSQGYGTHYATVWVGSPTPQRKSVIVDTGSHYTAFPCKGCSGCGEEYHTDQYFDYDISKTFQALSCNDCTGGAKCDHSSVDMKDRCIFTQSYTEGSSWTAFQAKDIFFCGGTDVLDAADPSDRQFATPFLFGCQIHETGLFVTQLADGIMGLSAHEATFPQQLYAAGKIQHNVFSLCFRQEMTVSKKGITAGVMTLGGFDPSLHLQPVRYAKNVAARTGGWYTIYVKNVFLRTHQNGNVMNHDTSEDVLMKIPIKRSVLNSGKGIIVDSGTTDTYLHESIHNVFSHAWNEVTGSPYSNSPIRLTSQELERLPTILLQIRADPNSSNNSNNNNDGADASTSSEQNMIHRLDPTSPNDIVLAIPAIHYMEYSPSKDLFTSRLYFTETKGGVLGANAMQGHDVIFDYENARVGFAPSNCKKVYPTTLTTSMQQQQQAQQHAQTPGDTTVEDTSLETIPGSFTNQNPNSLDCRLSTTPVLVTSCLDTVQNVRETCGNNPELVLDGKETWTTTILENNKKSGNKKNEQQQQGGLSCEQVFSFASNIENTEVNCDESIGICWKTQPCQISCSPVFAHIWEQRPTAVAPSSSSAETSKECKEDDMLEWSVCSSECQQSRIRSQPFTDGTCHQMTVDQRTCHIDDCALHDPCRIPFILHAIFVLRGFHPYQWTSSSREIFTHAFTNTLKRQQNLTAVEDGYIITDGDVKVLTPLPWFLHDNDGGQYYEKKTNIIDAFMTTQNKKNNYDETNSNNMVAGAKLVLELSMFNPNAAKSSSSDRSVCNEAEFYPLARMAHDIHVVLEHPIFVQELLQEISQQQQQQQDNNDDKFFRPLLNNQMSTQDSHMVASWTIKTDVDGGGKVHDHSLDPYLGKFDYIFVITYYLSTIPSIVSVLLSLFIVYINLSKGYSNNNQTTHDDEHGKEHENGEAKGGFKYYTKRFGTMIPNPLNLAHKKFLKSYHNMRGMHPKKYDEVGTNNNSKFNKNEQKSLILNDGGGLHGYHEDDESIDSHDSSLYDNNKNNLIKPKFLIRSNSFLDLEARTKNNSNTTSLNGRKHPQDQNNNKNWKENKKIIRKKEMMQYRSKLNSIIRN